MSYGHPSRLARHYPQAVQGRNAWPSESLELAQFEDRGRHTEAADRKGGQHAEIHWSDLLRASRVPKVDLTTLAKNMRAAGYDVKWRPPRLKVCRGKIDEQQRKRICDKLRKLPVSY